LPRVRPYDQQMASRDWGRGIRFDRLLVTEKLPVELACGLHREVPAIGPKLDTPLFTGNPFDFDACLFNAY
jgi:hypothetical protein